MDKSCSSVLKTLEQVYNQILSVLSASASWKVEEELLVMEVTVRDLSRLLKHSGEKLSLQRSFRDRFEEIERKLILAAEEKQKGIELLEKSLQELHVVRDSAEKTLRHVYAKEKEYVQIGKEFECKERQLLYNVREKEKKYEERCRKIRLKELEVESISKEVELKQEDLDKKLREVDLIINLNGGFSKQSKEAVLKNEDLEERLKEVDLIIRSNEVFSKQIDVEYEKSRKKYGELEFREKQLGLRERRFNEQLKELELKEKQVRLSFDEIELTQKKLRDTLKSKDTQIGDQHRESSSKRSMATKKFEEVKTKEKRQIGERFIEIASIGKKVEGQQKEIALKIKRIDELSNKFRMREEKSEEQFSTTKKNERFAPISKPMKNKRKGFDLKSNAKCLYCYR
ncbi:hypothetical protein ACFE04_000644 [Oxalis oulophora]